jgi:hypothetical protein
VREMENRMIRDCLKMGAGKHEGTTLPGQVGKSASYVEMTDGGAKVRARGLADVREC